MTNEFVFKLIKCQEKWGKIPIKILIAQSDVLKYFVKSPKPQDVQFPVI